MQKLEVIGRLVELAYGEGRGFRIDHAPAKGVDKSRAWGFEGPDDGPHFLAASIEELVDHTIAQLVKKIEADFSKSALAQAVYEQLRRELPRLEIPALKEFLMKPVGAP